MASDILTVKNAVIHEYIKADGSLGELRNSDKLLSIECDVVFTLAESIQATISKREQNTNYGVFDDTNREGPFPNNYDKYINGEVGFLDLTLIFMTQLKIKANKEEFATGGFIICLEYVFQGSTYIVLAMIKNTDSIRIENLTPEILKTLNLSKFHQLIRINQNTYEANKNEPPIKEVSNGYDNPALKNYLSFLSRISSTDPAKYFLDAVGCKNGISNNQATKSVYKCVSDYFKEDKLKKHQQDATQKLTEFLANRFGRTVSIVSIVDCLKDHFTPEFKAEEVDSIFEGLHNLMNTEKYDVPSTFIPSKSEVNKKNRVKYSTEAISLSVEIGNIDYENSNAAIYWNIEGKQLILNLNAHAKLLNEMNEKVKSQDEQ